MDNHSRDVHCFEIVAFRDTLVLIVQAFSIDLNFVLSGVSLPRTVLPDVLLTGVAYGRFQSREERLFVSAMFFWLSPFLWPLSDCINRTTRTESEILLDLPHLLVLLPY